MKTEEFDVEKAKAGQKVTNKKHQKVKIVSYNFTKDKPILCIVTLPGEEKITSMFDNYGCNNINGNGGHLLLVKEKPKKTIGWINIYTPTDNNHYLSTGPSIFNTEEQAEMYKNTSKTRIATTKIKFRKP